MNDIIYDIIPKHHDVLTNLSCLAAADRPQAQRAEASDADHDPDRSMDSDEERDFADQGPLTVSQTWIWIKMPRCSHFC